MTAGALPGGAACAVDGGLLEALSLPAKRSAGFGFGVRMLPGEATARMEIFGNDHGLLRRFREGDRQALAHVYWATVDKVEALLRKRLCGVGPAWAGGAPSELEDLVQEVFIRAFAPETRLGYDGLRPYLPYLFTIARNTLVDWWRRRGRELPTSLTLDDAPEEAAVDETAGSFADPRTMALVERFVRGLPADLRAVHEARFDRGLSQRDAAEALGMGRQTLRTLERRLTDQLREALAETPPERAPAAEAPRRWWQRRG
jgi:RNA polymerase sigma factor (sigma-70 family)